MIVIKIGVHDFRLREVVHLNIKHQNVICEVLHDKGIVSNNNIFNPLEVMKESVAASSLSVNEWRIIENPAL